jgi:hypothetical protein
MEQPVGEVDPPKRDFFNFDDSSLLERNYEPDEAYPNLSTPPAELNDPRLSSYERFPNEPHGNPAELNDPRLSSHERFPNEPHGNPHDNGAHRQLEAEY